MKYIQGGKFHLDWCLAKFFAMVTWNPNASTSMWPWNYGCEEPKFTMRYLDKIKVSCVTTLSQINSFAQQNHCPFYVKTTWIKITSNTNLHWLWFPCQQVSTSILPPPLWTSHNHTWAHRQKDIPLNAPPWV